MISQQKLDKILIENLIRIREQKFGIDSREAEKQIKELYSTVYLDRFVK